MSQCCTRQSVLCCWFCIVEVDKCQSFKRNVVLHIVILFTRCRSTHLLPRGIREHDCAALAMQLGDIVLCCFTISLVEMVVGSY